MHLFPFILIFTFTISFSFYMILGQQPYIGVATSACFEKGNLNSILGYTCSEVNPSCQAYLTFRAQPLYNSIPSISKLLGSDPLKISEANSVSEETTFETNKLVIVPINCSCVGDKYYQFNTSFVVRNNDNYFGIANNTFEGLSTCQALLDQNHIPNVDLYVGTKLVVPLRCACPSKNQTEEGVKYLISYLVEFGDDVYQVSERFGVTIDTILEANSLSLQQPTINPFTTLLVPLQDKPSSSQTVEPPLPPPPPPPPPQPSSNGSSSKTWVYIVVGVVGAFVLILLICSIIVRKHYLTQKRMDSESVSNNFAAKEKAQGKELEEESKKLSEIISGIAQSFKVYSFEELQNATNNFSPKCLIKGSVYEGIINGDSAAIKKIDGDVSKEIELLNKVNHSNVIRLSGVSFKDGHWYLVYEYAANGALSDWIYFNNNDENKSLSWTQRIQIALDVATGLDYLHSLISPPYIHKDLKCSNILLDIDFRAKIANFGFARSLELENDQNAMTRHIVGTRGYMAPEYLENGLVSTKLDVYAFGVMMLEILSGKEVFALYEESDFNLSSVVQGEHERLRDLMDSSLQGNYPLELAIFVGGMIDDCMKKDPTTRPSMNEIVTSLSKAFDSSLSWEQSVNRYHNFS
ncbi:hypothetical protein Lal_00028178 [Lupinus albus]|uniref:Uncharacterized protein n=1 Tax=Lupinus albus TaxID=3870 RepID=A0A6A5MLU4_LUPAL|nr:putative protein kinase RLK-Pelle-LysM family [Lupinus albus]KAF1872270.1 hypothetical protein Lal_00028178 [Lupinus albus]